jgi:hypothetical protein
VDSYEFPYKLFKYIPLCREVGIYRFYPRCELLVGEVNLPRNLICSSFEDYDSILDMD